MNGELGQLIAIASGGSAWLAGPPGAHPPPLQTDSWTFQYVGELSFTLEHPDMATTEAGSLDEWLRALRSRGVERLWLTTSDAGPVVVGRAPVEERYLVAFAGAGSWSLLATGRTNEVWRASWTVGDPDATEHRIWRVGYRGVALDGSVGPPKPSPVGAGLGLREALRGALAFAESQGLGEWAGVFEGAVAAGAEDDDLLSEHTSPQARALAASAARAWVFGGMGSWNDISFEGETQVRYERVSEDLYRAVLEAFVAATSAPLTT